MRNVDRQVGVFHRDKRVQEAFSSLAVNSNFKSGILLFYRVSQIRRSFSHVIAQKTANKQPWM
jgi:hypothetical protein